MRLLASIAVLSFLVRADSKPDPATAQLPADTLLVVRVASLDRLDELGNLRGVANLRGDAHWSDLLLKKFFGKADAPVARDRPFYVSRASEGVVGMFPAGEGAGDAARQGHLFASPERETAWQPRGRPFALPPGDASAVMRVGDVVEKFVHILPVLRDESAIEEFDLPRATKQALKLSAAFQRMAWYGVDEVHYGLTVKAGPTAKGESLVSNGRITVRPGTALGRGLAEVAEAAGPVRGLAAYLPRGALYVSESGGGLAKAEQLFTGVVDDYLGRDAGRCVHALLSPAMLFRARLTGRHASALDVRTLLAPATAAVWELKQAEPGAQALPDPDVATLNARLKELGIPARFEWDKNITTQAGVAIHRLQVKIDAPRLAAFAGHRKFCLAATNGLLLTYGGMDAVGGIRRLITRCQGDGDGDHPHVAALRRLAPRGCHEGVSFNLGALKPVARTIGTFLPQGAGGPVPPFVQRLLDALPEELYVSTALRMNKTAILLDGDWPLKTALDVLEAAGPKPDR